MNASKKSGRSPKWAQKGLIYAITVSLLGGTTACDSDSWRWLSDPNTTIHRDTRGRPYGKQTPRQAERIDPESPKDLCTNYDIQGAYAQYTFRQLPNPILVERTAENDLTSLIRRLQRSLNKEFNTEEMADILNLISAANHSQTEETTPEGIITKQDLGTLRYEDLLKQIQEQVEYGVRGTLADKIRQEQYKITSRMHSQIIVKII